MVVSEIGNLVWKMVQTQCVSVIRVPVHMW